MHTRTWTLHLDLDEHDGMTRAAVALHTDAGTELHATGHAFRNPQDREVPEIGDELAVSRALSGLAHQLLDAAAADVEANTLGTGGA